jgi:transposase
MDNTSLKEKILYLLEVEKLSRRQVIYQLHTSHRKLKRLLGERILPGRPKKTSVLQAYRHLLEEWYRQYPHLKALQIYQRIKECGYTGSLRSVQRFTSSWRVKKPVTYYALEFIAGEEAQVDWFFADLENVGRVALFLYVLSWSRYAWGKFYLKTSFEFFLDGHLECFRHLKGLARTHRYDNLKSVVLKHTPERIQYNPQFLEFARHYGFKIHACNPYKGNEKGRVERLGRDVRSSFLYGRAFKDYDDLNGSFLQWLIRRNNQIHRSTNETPVKALSLENLLKLPSIEFAPRRITQGVVSKTALVEFETNRYSVPSSLAQKPCGLLIYPDKIQITVASKIVARHKRSFDRHKIIQNPLHTESLLNKTPLFKYQRILRLIESMEPVFYKFLRAQGEDDSARLECAYQIFKLLKNHNRAVLISAVGELLSMGTYKIKALLSLLNLPVQKNVDQVFPNDQKLLDIRYEERSLEEYDQNP